MRQKVDLGNALFARFEPHRPLIRGIVPATNFLDRGIRHGVLVYRKKMRAQILHRRNSHVVARAGGKYPAESQIRSPRVFPAPALHTRQKAVFEVHADFQVFRFGSALQRRSFLA